ncbi:hypothetical protein G9F71_008720 [Clostridium sp. FP2]|uniref:hypothetical protein n=1 Tax=Clostridium sp. FP2 TaxID=2724481 RepID=UPI0013E901F7|nr:hypothetical protein [Clostridium sp. FP2]MBZ9622936.1 hypothetical protein [Clostridium sp. FP2]
MVKSFLKTTGYNAQVELKKLQTISDNAVSVFGGMVKDLISANEKLESLAANSDAIIDEHAAMAVSARGKIKSNADIIEKISKIMS